jgi:hypothetical protein
MSKAIFFDEFQKLQDDNIDEKSKLIYSLLYTTKIDINDLLNATCDQLIEMDGKGYIKTILNNFIELDNDVFNRLIHFLSLLKKPWGYPEAKYVFVNKKQKVNYIFESRKTDHNYKTTTLYSKFKKHCQMVGIERDLTLTSLTKNSLGSTITQIDQKLIHSRQMLIILINCPLMKNIRFQIFIDSYEELHNYSKILSEYEKEVFIYQNLQLTFINTLSIDEININLLLTETKSDHVFLYLNFPKLSSQTDFIQPLEKKIANLTYVIEKNNSILKSKAKKVFEKLLANNLIEKLHFIDLDQTGDELMNIFESLQYFLIKSS